MPAPSQFDCVIAGGGPAGLMLGVLLARAGANIAILEKHADFLRDFRGDTIHPSTMTVMHELGWLDEFLRLPYVPVSDLAMQFGSEMFKLADFSTLKVPAPFIAMMPQWDFLNFLAAKGRAYPGFSLFTETEVLEVVRDGDRVTGVVARTKGGEETFLAKLVVAADGRASVLRERAGLTVETIGAPMDVLWFRLPRDKTDTTQTQARFEAGRIFIMLNRGEYWQCAFVIPKDGIAAVHRDGLEKFHTRLAGLLPFDAERVHTLASWDDIKLLTVKIDRLTDWARPGLLCIGDAAHAMSPVGGVGVNLAVQDAVAAANILAEPLKHGPVPMATLQAVQRRRDFPTRMTQRMQVFMQSRLIAPALQSNGQAATLRPPAAVRLISGWPWLRRFPARLIGLGVQPEHIGPTLQEPG